MKNTTTKSDNPSTHLAQPKRQSFFTKGKEGKNKPTPFFKPNAVLQKMAGIEPGLVATERNGAATMLSPKVVQLKPKGKSRKKQHKGQGRKASRRTGPARPESKMGDFDIGDDADVGVSYRNMAEEGSSSLGVFEEEYEVPQLFWRGDSRGPDEVFETGFTTKNERGKKVKKGANKIVWRGGGDKDDILPASAVCLAKDVRGSAFFPLEGEGQFYMYAVAKTRVVNTFKVQKEVEKAETGSSDYEDPRRYQYDPEYNDSENASAVWQFQEYAAHRVESTEILACFKVERKTLVPPGGGATVAIAGIQFRLEFENDAPIHRLNKRNKKLFKQMKKLQTEAKSIAEQYADFYPEENDFLSYMGIVTPIDTDDMPQDMGEAPEKVFQKDAVVIQEKAIDKKNTVPSKSTSMKNSQLMHKPGPEKPKQKAARSFFNKKNDTVLQQKAAPFFKLKSTLQKMDKEEKEEVKQPVQKKENKTGLPDQLKAGVENLSGLSMDDVQVHYNSSKPAQLNAHAYAQGTDIHIAPGQDKHLPHEAWHVVQQKQGRVQATRQMRDKVAINDDAGLEKEADVMGAKANNVLLSKFTD